MRYSGSDTKRFVRAFKGWHECTLRFQEALDGLGYKLEIFTSIEEVEHYTSLRRLETFAITFLEAERDVEKRKLLLQELNKGISLCRASIASYIRVTFKPEQREDGRS